MVTELVGKLVSGQALAISTDGMPGVGKTTLAVALARHPDIIRHFVDGVLWIHLGPDPHPAAALAALGTALDLDVISLPSGQARDLIQNTIGYRRILIVIDDAWDVASARLLRCGGPNCCHLLTTRKGEVARAFADGNRVETVPELDVDSGFELLSKLARGTCEADPAAARVLVHAVGGLPLAIELLGGYLSAPERRYFAETAATALQELRDPRRRLELAAERLGSGEGETLTLQATIELSLYGLPQPAVEAFHSLGAFAAKPVHFDRSAALEVTGVDPSTLAELIDRKLIEVDDDQLATHQTIADAARTQTSAGAVERHRMHYLRMVDMTGDDLSRLQAVHGQLRWAGLQFASKSGYSDFVWAVPKSRELLGLWHGRPRWDETAPEGAGVFGEPGLAMLYNDLGVIFNTLGQRQRALDYHERARRILEPLGDANSLALTLNHIGRALNALGKPRQALERFQKALALFHDLEHRPGQADTLNNLGVAYHTLDEHENALKHYMLELPLREDVGDRQGLAVVLNNVGVVNGAINRHQVAVEYLERALVVREEVGDRRGLAVSLNNVGGAYEALGEREKALVYYERALRIKEEIGDRQGQAITLSRMAGVYEALEQVDLARTTYHRVLPIQGAIGDLHGEAHTRFKLAKMYRRQGRLTEAMDEFLKVAELDERTNYPSRGDVKKALDELRHELKAPVIVVWLRRAFAWILPSRPRR
jgi:tetratricopeptide (TPR) repeat protein